MSVSLQSPYTSLLLLDTRVMMVSRTRSSCTWPLRTSIWNRIYPFFKLEMKSGYGHQDSKEGGKSGYPSIKTAMETGYKLYSKPGQI